MILCSTDFDDFPRTNARRAGPDGFGRALHQGMHLPQVGIPTALRHIVRVTDMVAKFGTFSAKVAGTSHCLTPLESNTGLLQPPILSDNRDFAHRQSALAAASEFLGQEVLEEGVGRGEQDIGGRRLTLA
jgi:hypothetical protein